uniref:Uncharacterized protein n=1 Tax=Knipowitschia caucasica TaxID=637954 RepID=A0AAV2KJA6_KNICA
MLGYILTWVKHEVNAAENTQLGPAEHQHLSLTLPTPLHPPVFSSCPSNQVQISKAPQFYLSTKFQIIKIN